MTARSAFARAMLLTAVCISASGQAIISPATLPSGQEGVPYSVALSVTGNPPLFGWEIAPDKSKILPASLTINPATGVISGVPAFAGSWPFTVIATLAAPVGVQPSTVTQQYTLVISPRPAVVIGGLPAIGVAATQPAATISLSGGTYPLSITGTMSLAFTPAGGANQPFDAKFASGSPSTANFNIAAGSTQGLFGTASSLPVMIGTVAGTITITTSLQDSIGNTYPASAPVVMTVNPTVPVISKVTFGPVANGTFTISVTGRSTPRDMTSGLFHFALPTNTQPSTLDVTVPLSTAFTAWYGSSSSTTFGSTFTATVQFTFTGPPGSTVPFTAVTVTMTNSVGASNAFGPVNP